MRVAGIVVATLAVAVATASGAYAAPAVERSERAQPKRAVLDYWTDERIRQAGPPPGAEPDAAAAAALGQAYASAAAKKGPPRRAPRRSYTSKKVPDATARPYISTGRIFGRVPGAGAYECSGTVVHTPSRSVVFTAAHCLNVDGAFADTLIFIPGYRNGNEPYGRWAFEELVVPGQYPPLGNPKYDFGAVRLARRQNQPIENVVGARNVRISSKRRQTYRALGYPINRGDGQRLWGCRSKAQIELRVSGKHDPVGIGCDMSFGASGGPWIGSSGDVVSVTSLGIDRYKNYVFGPRLRGEARQVLDEAGAG